MKFSQDNAISAITVTYNVINESDGEVNGKERRVAST
jgi:hypothetical protein